MKKIIIFISALMCLATCNVVFAEGQYSEIKEKVKEIAKMKKQTGKLPVISDSLRAQLSTFIRLNKDTPPNDFGKMRVLVEASVIIQREMQEKYKSRGKELDKKMATKKERELYDTTRYIIGHYIKMPKQYYLLCKGNESDAEKGMLRADELREKVKDLDPNSSEFIEAYEQVLAGCKYDENVIWELLARYRGLQKSDKYNKLMLRIIKEDQVVYDYSGSVTDDIDSGFRNEYLTFLAYNSPSNVRILTKEQVRLIGETALTKYQAAFSLKGLEDPNAIIQVVSPMIVLSMWLKHYKLDDLRAQFITKYFDDEVVIRTIMVFAETGEQRYQEHLDYLKEKGLIKTE